MSAPYSAGAPGGNAAPVFDLVKSIDRRLTPETAAFAAAIGAQSITYVQQKVNQANTSTHTFQCTPPSPGVVIQRDIQWNLRATVQFTSSHRAFANNTVWPRYGKDFAIAGISPLNQLVSSWNITMNSNSAQFTNLGVRDLLHAITTPSKRALQGVNYRTPMYTNWDDADGTTFGLGGVEDLQGDGDVPPGAYPVEFCLPVGPVHYWSRSSNTAAWAWVGSTNVPADTPVFLRDVALAFGGGTYAVAYTTIPGQNGQVLTDAIAQSLVGVALTGTGQFPGSYQTGGVRPGQPYSPFGADNTSATLGAGLQVYNIAVTLVDAVQCPPFGWSAARSISEQGIWGINNMLIVAVLQSPGDPDVRWLQGTRKGGMSSLTYQSWVTLDSSMWFTYLSPAQNKAQLLPPRCVVDFLYKQTTQFQQTNGPIPAGGYATIDVPSYTFGNVANSLIIAPRPTGLNFYECDYYGATPDSPFPQFTYVNQSGLLSNWSRQKQVGVQHANGITAGTAQMGGMVGPEGSQLCGSMMKAGQLVGMGSTPMLLTPGIDFALPVGVAGGTAGLVQLQYSIKIRNQGIESHTFAITTTNVSNGFFIFENGAARQIQTGLDEEAVLAAPMGLDMFSISNLTGGGSGFLERMSCMAGRLKDASKHLTSNSGASSLKSHEAGGSAAPVSGGVAGQKRYRGALAEAMQAIN